MEPRSQRLKALSLVIIFLLSLFAGASASAQQDSNPITLELSASGYERAHALAFSSNGDYLAVGGLSGVYIFDSKTRSLQTFIETKTWARSLAFLPGADTLAAGLFDNTIKSWEVNEGKLLWTLEGAEGWVRRISVSGDGGLIASASDDDTLRVWDTQKRAPVLELDQNTSGLRAAAISPDGRLVAGALADHTVRVWEVSSGSLVYTLTGHSDWVRNLAFSPDGGLLASGSFDKNVLLWDMADGSLSRTLEGHTSSILDVAFSPDGKLLASGSVDETVRVWDVQSARTLHILPGHNNFVYSVAFSPDGNTLATGGGDNAVRLWDLQALAAASPEVTDADLATPSDCRACHHSRGSIEPPRVIDMSCEACHANGIGLSWCVFLPRASAFEALPAVYQAVPEVSGVPVNGGEVAVVITTPSNGETYYANGGYLAVEKISGKVYHASQETVTKVKVRLDIIAGGQKTASLETYPAANGTFTFEVEINPDRPPPTTAIYLCQNCHNQSALRASLPEGEVTLSVTATAPDSSQAFDERWLRVDSSKRATLPVQVLDAETGEAIPGLTAQASTVLYEWRARTASAVTDEAGTAHLTLEALSQTPAVYELSIPTQPANDKLYSGSESVKVTLEPGKTSYPPITLIARAQKGSLTGSLHGAAPIASLSDSLAGMSIWAFQLPTGPVFQAALAPDGAFSFDELPVDRYLVFTDPAALARHGFSVQAQEVDLTNSPASTLSLELTKKRQVSGKVTSKAGAALPFAWITAGGETRAAQVDPVSGEFLLSDLPSEASYLTVSAPGYYSLSRAISPSDERIDFQLSPHPEMQRLAWGEGEVFLSSPAEFSIEDLNLSLEQGWLWGSGGASQPLEIHLPGVDVRVAQGRFALESPSNATGWLYLYEGTAEVRYRGTQEPVELSGGEMVALVKEGTPLPMDPAITSGIRPPLDKVPIKETIEPTLISQLENGLAKAGIQVSQGLTFIAYLLSAAIVVGIPAFALVRRNRERRDPVVAG